MFISGWLIAVVVIGAWLVERDNKQKLKEAEEALGADLQLIFATKNAAEAEADTPNAKVSRLTEEIGQRDRAHAKSAEANSEAALYLARRHQGA